MQGKHKFHFAVTRTVKLDVRVEIEASSLTEAYIQAKRYCQFGDKPEGGELMPVSAEVLEYHLMMGSPLPKPQAPNPKELH